MIPLSSNLPLPQTTLLPSLQDTQPQCPLNVLPEGVAVQVPPDLPHNFVTVSCLTTQMIIGGLPDSADAESAVSPVVLIVYYWSLRILVKH